MDEVEQLAARLVTAQQPPVEVLQAVRTILSVLQGMSEQHQVLACYALSQTVVRMSPSSLGMCPACLFHEMWERYRAFGGESYVPMESIPVG